MDDNSLINDDEDDDFDDDEFEDEESEELEEEELDREYFEARTAELDYELKSYRQDISWFSKDEMPPEVVRAVSRINHKFLKTLRKVRTLKELCEDEEDREEFLEKYGVVVRRYKSAIEYLESMYKESRK